MGPRLAKRETRRPKHITVRTQNIAEEFYVRLRLSACNCICVCASVHKKLNVQTCLGAAETLHTDASFVQGLLGHI